MKLKSYYLKTEINFFNVTVTSVYKRLETDLLCKLLDADYKHSESQVTEGTEAKLYIYLEKLKNG